MPRRRFGVYGLWFMVRNKETTNYQPITHNSFGFTLIEILIVMVIISIIGVGAFVNFRTLSQDQVITKAFNETQSYLRLAQSNSTTGVICPGQTESVSWKVRFNSNRKDFDLTCGPSDSVQSSMSLVEAEIFELHCLTSGNNFSLPLTVEFAPLTGKVIFDAEDSCIDSSSTSSIKITIKNPKNTNSATNTKSFTITKGGAIDVQ